MWRKVKIEILKMLFEEELNLIDKKRLYYIGDPMKRKDPVNFEFGLGLQHPLTILGVY
jgi:hypothetical protein